MVNFKKNYFIARSFLDFINSKNGAIFKEKFPQIVEAITNAWPQIQKEYYEDSNINNPNLSKEIAEMVEVKDLLEILPSTSQTSILELNGLLTEMTKSFSNKLSFDPGYFYKKYFFNLATPISKNVDIEVFTKNDRFQNWFLGSKVVDENGVPKILYHGTSGLKVSEFDEFSFEMFPGAYFAVNKTYSDWFMTIRPGMNQMYQVCLRVLNPIDITHFHVDLVPYDEFVLYLELKYGVILPENRMLRALSDADGGIWAWRYLRGGIEWLKLIAENNKFDGIHYYENNPGDKVDGKDRITEAWMVFHGNQIKSVDARNSSFSLETNNIKMEKGGEIC